MSWSLVAAVLLALALGGDFRRLATLHIRGWWLLVLALAFKIGLLVTHQSVPWAQSLIFVLVAVGALLNWRLPGMPLLAVGLLLNIVAVVSNGGIMPYSAN